MMKKAKSIFTAALFCLLAAAALSVAAQSAGYTKLNVKGRVQLEIPSDWAISDAEQRRRVKEFGEKLVGIPTQHTASLAAQSYPAPSRTMVRVSFIPMEPPLSQAEVRQEVQANKQQVLRDLSGGWREESPTMWAGLAKNGVKEVGRPSFAAELNQRLKASFENGDISLSDMKFEPIGRDGNAVYFSMRMNMIVGETSRPVTGISGITLLNSLPLSINVYEGTGSPQSRGQLQAVQQELLNSLLTEN